MKPFPRSIHKSVLAVALLGAFFAGSAGAWAASYQIRVPARIEAVNETPVEKVELSIQSAGLPEGKVGLLYAYDFSSLLSISGLSEGYNLSDVSWSMKEGSALPQGLELTHAGRLQGTPGAAGAQRFAVVANYLDIKGRKATGEQSFDFAAVSLPTGDGVGKEGACTAAFGVTGCSPWSRNNGAFDVTWSNGDRIMSLSDPFGRGVYAKKNKSSGKWYAEVRVTQGTTSSVGLYPIKLFGTGSNPLAYQTGSSNGLSYQASGPVYINNLFKANIGAYSAGDVIGLAYDLDTGSVKISVNCAERIAFSDGALIGSDVSPHARANGPMSISINAGQENFACPVPAGYMRGIW